MDVKVKADIDTLEARVALLESDLAVQRVTIDAQADAYMERLRLRARVEELERTRCEARNLETEIEYLRKGPQGDAWQRAWHQRDLAVAEAVRSEIVELCQGSSLVVSIRALDLDAIVKGVKS